VVAFFWEGSADEVWSGRTWTDGRELSRDALEKKHEVVGYDLHPDPALRGAGVSIVDSLASLVAQVPTPRIIFLYVRRGDATESACEQLRPLLASG
jgi:6-phosphogluconate dehydrogenase